MAVLLKTTSVRVSSIQIMQIRVQNKGKRVWKNRYDGDVSPALLNFMTLFSEKSSLGWFHPVVDLGHSEERDP